MEQLELLIESATGCTTEVLLWKLCGKVATALKDSLVNSVQKAYEQKGSNEEVLKRLHSKVINIQNVLESEFLPRSFLVPSSSLSSPSFISIFGVSQVFPVVCFLFLSYWFVGSGVRPSCCY